MKIDYKKELNKRQYEAVVNIEGPQLVIAGAGTGKTRTLCYRAAYLVDKGIKPRSILILTFTKKAAGEMMKRASNILDNRCRYITGGTFHSFANSILRRYAAVLGYQKNFTIADRSDSEDIINLLRAKFNLNKASRRFPKKNTIMDMISKSINRNMEISEIIELEYPQYTEEITAVENLREEYDKYKFSSSIMDYDDLLINMKRLLRENKRIREKISSDKQYIMVDEYQDTNKLQAEIACLLASSHGNIMVVGDDSQSIYSFRGADFKNIMEFPKIFPNAKIITLEENYRSTQPILNFANSVIEKAKEKFTKHLFSDINGEQKPYYITSVDDGEQSQFICEKILELREKGIELNNIAVLFRSGWHSNELEIELNNYNIPFEKYGGRKFVELAHVKDILSLIRIALNVFDAVGWNRFLLLIDGIGRKTADSIIEEICDKKAGISYLSSDYIQRKKYGKKLNSLKILLENIDENSKPAAAVDKAVKFYEPILKEKYEDHKRRSNDLKSIRRIAEKYKKIEYFITDLMLEPPEKRQIDTLPDDKDDEKLILSTIHSAKGLEWHSVFILNLLDGFLPSSRSMENESNIEEERRLFYVAATRAKKNLFLLIPEIQRMNSFNPYYSGFDFGAPSRFLLELENLSELTEDLKVKLEKKEEVQSENTAKSSDDLFDRIADYFNE